MLLGDLKILFKHIRYNIIRNFLYFLLYTNLPCSYILTNKTDQERERRFVFFLNNKKY